MATKPKITAREKARTKKKVGLAVYFTFIATFALCFGAQLWMIDVFNPNEETSTPQNYSTDAGYSSSKQVYSNQPQNQTSTNNNNTYTSQNNQNSNVDSYQSDSNNQAEQNTNEYVDYNYQNRN